MLLPLIEDAAAIDELEAIAAIPGIDGLFLGPYDLSVSVGAPGADFNHPKMSDALDRTVRRAGNIPKSSSPRSATGRSAITAKAS